VQILIAPDHNARLVRQGCRERFQHANQIQNFLVIRGFGGVNLPVTNTGATLRAPLTAARCIAMSLPLAAAAATVADVNTTTLSLLWAIKAGKVSGRRSEHRGVVGAEPHAAAHTEAPHCHASAAFGAEIGRGTRARKRAQTESRS
jgi:hypothetical protein